MKISLVKLQHEVHMDMLSLQRLYRYLCSHRFSWAYDLASEEQVNTVIDYINKRDKFSIIRWVGSILKAEYETFSMSDLRELAKKVGVQQYGMKTKDMLLSEISVILGKE